MKKIFVLSFFVFVAALCAGGCALRYVSLCPYEPGKYYTARTSDNWTLALYRYSSQGVGLRKAPVILCHGLGMNGTLWDLTERKSFARYLAAQGFDVWVADLRGAGRSTKPGWVMLHDLMSGPDIAPERYSNTTFRFEKSNWDMDDYITKDIPAIIKEVQRVTGSEKVQWVGHSMGGMIMFAYLAQTGDTAVQSFVAMASPMNMPRPHTDLLNILEGGSDLKQLVYLLNNRIVGRTFGFVASFTGTPLDPMLYNRENMENADVSALLNNTLEDLSPGVLEGFIDLIKTGDFTAHDKSVNYTQSLAKVKTRMLFVGGWMDTLCNIVSLYDAYRAVGSEDKTLRVFGRANGYRADYGHNDLIVGRFAPVEVYPYVARWLKEKG